MLYRITWNRQFVACSLDHESIILYRVMRRNSPSSQESHLGLFELASPEVGARKVLQHLDIGVLVELLQAVLVHLRHQREELKYKQNET